MSTRCEEIMRKVCEDFEAELKEFNGERRLRPPDTAGGTSQPEAGGEFTGRTNHTILHAHL